MTHVQEMLDTYPRTFNVDGGVLVATIEALVDCANTCVQCADACMSEQNIADLAKCIRLNMDCADICGSTSRVVSRQTDYDANVTRPLLDACIASCRSCADECASHAEMMEHCRVCAETCRRCADRCSALLAAMS
jgi:hypothetical protein